MFVEHKWFGVFGPSEQPRCDIIVRKMMKEVCKIIGNIEPDEKLQKHVRVSI
jgi:hypothetical protein